MMFILFFISLVNASDVGGKEVLQNLESAPKQRFSLKRATPTAPIRNYSSAPAAEAGNLTGKLVRSRGTSISASKNLVVRPKDGVASHDINVLVGDVFDCRIYQDIIGYVGSVSPVRAEILNGPYKGYFFVGNATMDPKTKHILVQFHKIRSPSGSAIVKVTATVQSVTGELGLEGTVTSHYWQYFFASVLASAAEGYAQATVQRQQNVFGNYQNVPTTETAAKTGVATGASQTADVMAEQMKSAPEYTTVRGPITTRIFIIDDVKS